MNVIVAVANNTLAIGVRANRRVHGHYRNGDSIVTKVVECEEKKGRVSVRKTGRKEQVCECWEGKKEKWGTRVERMRPSLIYVQRQVQLLDTKDAGPWFRGALMSAVYTLGSDWHSSCHEVHH